MRTSPPIDTAGSKPTHRTNKLPAPSRSARVTVLLLAFGGSAAALTACTAILGDFKVAAVDDGGAGDGDTTGDVQASGDAGNDGQGPSTTFDDVIQVAAGEKHTCALRSDRTVYCWGDNSRGQLGTSTAGPGSKVPVKVANLKNVRAISAGSQHSCALTFDISNPAAGGRIFCWGDNTLRQLGRAAPADMSFDPVAVIDPSVSTNDWNKAAALVSGLNTNCAVDTGGGLFCWGDNSAGQFGTGSNTPAKAPSPTPPNPTIFVQGGEIAAGGSQACAVGTSAGITQVSTICWGGGPHGEVGNGFTSGGPYGPVGVAPGATDAGAAPYKHVVAGHTHTCAIDGNLDVFCWGSNDFGESGPSSAAGAPHPMPGLVPPAHGAVAVGAGEQSSCALVNGAFKVKCWGKNTFGELGNGTTDTTGSAPQAQPQEVSGIQGVGQISVGARHVCAVIKPVPQKAIDDTKGSVLCWGSGENGRLGNNSESSSNVPVHVVAPAN